jgi:hypothetical protein
MPPFIVLSQMCISRAQNPFTSPPALPSFLLRDHHLATSRERRTPLTLLARLQFSVSYSPKSHPSSHFISV